jgi:transposase
MRGYSIDLRERVVKAVKEEQQSTKEVAKRFGLSRWTVNRYMKREAEGKLAASKPPGRPQGLDEVAQKHLRAQVKEHKDWSLEQHAEALSKAKVSKLKKSSIGNYFKRLGITIKKDVLPSRTR